MHYFCFFNILAKQHFFMKILSALICFCITSSVANSQWIPLNSTTNKDLYNIKFLNENYGIAVGDGGTILKTTDGGSTWITLPFSADDDFRDVALLGTDTIFVSSVNSTSPTVYRSADAGLSWQKVLVAGLPISICITEDNHIYAATDSIYESEDGGESWVGEYDFSGTLVPFDIQFVNKETGHVGANIGGFVTYSAIVIRTADGGNTWSELDVFSFPNAAALTAFSFTDPDTGFLFMNEFDLFSPNDSSQLIRVYDFELIELFGDSLWVFEYDSLNFDFPDYVNDCDFFSSKIGYAVGNNGIVYRTMNDGSSWIDDYSGDEPLFAIDMINENTGYAVGASGTILKRGFGTGLISTLGFDSELPIFPNPTTQQSVLKFYLPTPSKVQITIRNSNGKIMEAMSQSLLQGSQSISLNTSVLPAGAYMIQISDGTKHLTTKMMVVH